MLTGILAFFSALPSIINGISAFQKNYFDEKVRLTAIKVGGDVNVAKAIVTGIVAEGQTRVQFLDVVSKSKSLTSLIWFFAFPIGVWFNKVILWDKVLALGSTDPITGEAADITKAVIYGIFGGTGVIGAASIYTQWRSK